jgi:hypothetical protein
LTLNGLHGVIYQKMILFITTAVKISNPTFMDSSSVFKSRLLFVDAVNFDRIGFLMSSEQLMHENWQEKPK